MKKRALKSMLFAICLLSVFKSEIQAKEETYYSKEDVKEFGKKIGKGLLDKVVDINDNINEQVSELKLYKHESLWLITDKPNINPDEERNYYFVDANYLFSFTKITIFYDQYGNQVAKNDPSAVRKLERTMYPYLTLEVEETFYMEYDYDLINCTFVTNFVDFNEDYLWDAETTATYGRIVDIDKVIPEDLQKAKYSDADLQEILEVINDPSYEFITSSSLKREKSN